MDQARYTIIKAYFEGNRFEDESSMELTLPVGNALIPAVQKLLDKRNTEGNYKVETDTVFIQFEDDWTPPAGMVFQAEDGDIQIMLETDKFGNMINFYWEEI